MRPMPSLDDIIQATRQEAQRPEYQIGNIEALVPPPSASVFAAPGAAVFSTHAAQPVAANPVLAATHVDELLLVSDPNAFVEAAYQSLLHRAADPVGAGQYLDKLATGHGQAFVIAALAASGEARQTGRRLGGLGLSGLFYNLWCVGRRLGLAGPARLCNLAYSAWRHVLLLPKGKLLSFVRQGDQRVAQQLALAAEQQRNQLAQLGGQAQEFRHQTSAAQAQQQAALDQLAQTSQQFTERAEQHFQTQAQHNDQTQAALFALKQQAERAVERNQRELQLLKARVTVLQQKLLPPATQSLAPVPAPASSSEDASALEARLDAYYLAFEEAHRGTQQEIADKLAVYLPHVCALPEAILALPMLDIGCGRGEWMQMLVHQGFTARGVDLSPQMVALCRGKGLDARLSDAVAWLAAQPDQSHALISGFHIVEHLPFPVQLQLLEHAYRVLAPGGKLIFETPNPENVLVGSHTFYHDPTHRNPMTPSSLDFMLRYHGFAHTETLRLNPYPASHRVQEFTLTAERLNGHLCGPQDFAVIGTRALVSGG